MDVSLDYTDSTVTTGDATSGQAGARQELAGGAAGGSDTQNGESLKREKKRKELPGGLHLEDISWFRYMGFSYEDCNTLLYFGFEPWVNDCEEMSEFLDHYNTAVITNAASGQTGEKDGRAGGADCGSDMQDGKSVKQEQKRERKPQIGLKNKCDSVLAEDRAGEDTPKAKCGGHGSDEGSLGLDLEDMGWFDYMGYSQEVCETLLYYGCGPWVNDCEEKNEFLDHYNTAVMTNAVSGQTGEKDGPAVGAVCESDMQDGNSAKKEEKCQREPQIGLKNKSDSVLAEVRAGEDTTTEVDCGGHGSDVCGSDMQDGKSAKQEQKRERKPQIGLKNKSDSVLAEDRAGEDTPKAKCGGHGSDEGSLGLDLEDMGWFDYMGYSQEVCETLLYYGCGPWVNDCEEMSEFMDHCNS